NERERLQLICKAEVDQRSTVHSCSTLQCKNSTNNRIRDRNTREQFFLETSECINALSPDSVPRDWSMC
ncbi:hypothetical protein L9F63_014878, partial [Diploptera punctata]